MHNNKALLIICAAALILRLSLAWQAPSFSYSGYETIRQVEHITETGLPIIKDSLEQRTSIPLPVFHYILAFSTIVLPDNLAYIIVPNLLAVLLHAALFYLILELTNNTQLSLLGAAASIFIPSYIESTLVTLAPAALAIPLFIITVTLFLKLRKSAEKKTALLLTFIALSFTHPLALLSAPFFVLSMLLISVKRAKGETAQQEFAIFSVLYLLWLNILLYKDSLATTGIKTLFANSPVLAVAPTVVEIAAAIGIMPFCLSLYAAYKESTTQHIGILVTISLALTIAATMLLKISPVALAASLLGTICIALAAVALQHIYEYVKGFRRKHLKNIMAFAMTMLFILTSVVPSLLTGVKAASTTADPAVLSAAEWLSENSLKSSLVLTKPEWGFVFETIANRPVYLDEHYLNTPAVKDRYANTQAVLANKDVRSITISEHIDYIVSEQRVKESCVNTVYSEGVYIAKVLCE